MTDALPPGWSRAPLADVGAWGSGGTPSRSDAKAYGGDIPWLKIGDLSDGPVVSAEERITEHGLSVSAAKLLPPRTLLVAMYGSIGKLGITTELCATNQAIAFCKPHAGIDLHYLFYLLMSERHRLLEQGQGGTQQNISQTILKAHEVSIAPSAEQRRIVSKINELFSRIDEGKRALERVSMLLERYRQSVLKAAITGELTRAWRERNRAAPESGESLLARILSARRGAWEKAELEKIKAKGITPSNDNWKQKYDEPSSPDVGSLPQLPEGWVWGSFAQLFVVASDEGRKLKEREYAPCGELPVVDQGANFVSGWTDRRDLAFSGHLPVIGFGDHTRRFKLIQFPFVIGADGLKLFNSISGYSSDFAMIALGASQLEDRGYSRHFQFLKKVAFPIPSESEQAEIVEAYSRLSSQADALVNQLDLELRRIDALRQSVLSAAFGGRLSSQDPADENASDLLDRIAAGRGDSTSAAKRGRKKKVPA